jgi:mycothiol synthase
MDDLYYFTGLLPGSGDGSREEVHGRSDFQFPQLELVRPDLEGLPAIRLPPGYTLRSYQPGDEEAWGGIMTEAFNPYWNAERFRKLLLAHFGFRAERLLFVCRGGTPVGSAAAFQWPGVPRFRGYIHMVGVKKADCGRGLGYWLTVACLARFREDGFSQAMLQTEDFRLPALKHYLRLGFRPVLVSEEQRERWVQTLRRIGGPELAEKLGLSSLPAMNRLAFWWRTMLVVNYLNWLALKADLSPRRK